MSLGPSGFEILVSEGTAASRTVTFHVTLASDHITNATGKTMVCTLSKAGGAFGAAAGTVTELTNGWYKLVLAAADLDTLGCLAILLTEAASDPVRFTAQVVGFDPKVALAVDSKIGTPAVSLAADMSSVVRDLKTRHIDMGSLAADGATKGYSVQQGYDTVITVTGTFGGGSAQPQVCADPTAVSPVWVNSGSALAANGSKTIAGPVNAVRVNLSGSTSPTLAVSAEVREFKNTI